MPPAAAEGGKAGAAPEAARPEYLQLYTRHSLSRNGIRQDAAQLFEEEEDGEERVRLRGGLPPSICAFPVVRSVLCDVVVPHSWALTLISFPRACNL